LFSSKQIDFTKYSTFDDFFNVKVGRVKSKPSATHSVQTSLYILTAQCPYKNKGEGLSFTLFKEGPRVDTHPDSHQNEIFPLIGRSEIIEKIFMDWLEPVFPQFLVEETKTLSSGKEGSLNIHKCCGTILFSWEYLKSVVELILQIPEYYLTVQQFSSLLLFFTVT